MHEKELSAPSASPSADDVAAAHAVQAVATLTLLEMAAWRLERLRAAGLPIDRLRSIDPGRARAPLRRLVGLTRSHGAPNLRRLEDDKDSGGDAPLVNAFMEGLKQLLASPPLSRGGWMVLRTLAARRSRRAAARDLAGLLGVPVREVLETFGELERAGCIVIARSSSPDGDDNSATARLMRQGALQASLDPLPEVAARLQDALVPDALCRLMQFASALLRVKPERKPAGATVSSRAR